MMEEKKQYKGLVAFDLDNTLLDHESWQITPSALDAIDSLRENGYLTALATGRDMHGRHSQQYLDILDVDAVIHMNGTGIELHGEVLLDHVMDKELLRRFLDYCSAHGHAVGMDIGGLDYYTFPDKVTDHDLRFFGFCDRNYQDPYGLLEQDVRALAYAGDTEGARELREQFPELKILMFSASTGADVFEAAYSKAEGIRFLCRELGIPEDCTYAFGDSFNDLEMLEAAHVGIAVGNALPEVRERADYVAPPIAEDGVAKALRHFGLIT